MAIDIWNLDQLAKYSVKVTLTALDKALDTHHEDSDTCPLPIRRQRAGVDKYEQWRIIIWRMCGNVVEYGL